jgi:hypothetical protein
MEGYLHLAYYGAEMTLHRQILRSLSHETNASLITICRSAAQSRLTTVMDFVRSLRAEHLQSFWYSSSKYCFALVGTFIGLLWVSAGSKDEAEGYKEKLEEYRWTLRLSSKSAEFLDRAISKLTTSTGLLMKAIPESQRPPASMSGSPNALTTESAMSHTDEEEWIGNDQNSIADSISMQPSPTSFSENGAAIDMLWPNFGSLANGAFVMPEPPLPDTSGFSMQPFLGIGGDFDVPTAYQPHYGSNGAA